MNERAARRRDAEIVPVNPRIDNVKNNDPGLIEPLSAET